MRVALITGTTGGLGERLALRLDRLGYSIVIHYCSSGDKARKLSERLERTSCILQGDISVPEDVGNIVRTIERKVGRLDVLINNAAVTKDRPLVKYPEAAWDKVIAVNLKGAFNCIRYAVPLIAQSGGGHIMLISSYAGVRGKEGQCAYSASKSALIGLASTLAQEVSHLGIAVNTLVPGYLPLGMGMKAPTALEAAKKASILKSLSNPDDVANCVAYLVGTRGITGQVFSLDSRM